MNTKTISPLYPKVRLAIGSHSKNYTAALNGWRALGYEPPCLLCSYVYYGNGFAKRRLEYEYSDWSLDSGAYTAFHAKKEIDLQRYIDFCKEAMANDSELEEVFSLDVIGDYEASVRNTEEMWRQGVPAIPVFHVGEPWSVLEDMVKTYPKISFSSGGLMNKQKQKWIQQVFARAWPARIHGLAISDETSVMSSPFHSVDASTWILRAQGFGSWHLYGNMPLRGTNALGSQVEYYLKLQAQARQKWKKEMALLAELPKERMR